MSATTKDLVKKFIKLDQSIKKKEGEVDKLKEEKGPLEAELLRRFQEGGIASMKSSTGVNVYIRRDLWSGAVDGNKDALHAAIKSVPDIANMVKETVNSQTFSAYVRERIDEHFGEDAKKKPVETLKEALPIALQPVTCISEKYSLRATKS
jgi:hypothetical protein